MAIGQTLKLAGKEYPLYDKYSMMGMAIKTNNRCAYQSKFKKIKKDCDRINKASGKVVDFQTNLKVQCSTCHTGLNSHGIGLLIMSEKFGNMSLGGKNLDELKKGKCPQCGNSEYFYIFDPDGF